MIGTKYESYLLKTPFQEVMMGHMGQQQQQQQHLQQQPPQQQQQQQQQPPPNPQQVNQNSNYMQQQQAGGSGPSGEQPMSDQLTAQTPNNHCIRSGCPNPAVANSEWEDEYCSNECVVTHCKDVFSSWVASNQNSAVK